MKTAAILYQPDGFETQGQRLMGRQAAGEGFLKALARHGKAESLYCSTKDKAGFEAFSQQVRPWLSNSRPIRWLPAGNPVALAEAGTLYRPDPLISELAWQRRFANQQAYSLCGVTHTLASKGAMEGIGNLLIAPIQPWDAVICTSRAVKMMVERLLGSWAEYLAVRLGAKPAVQFRLPVIPLGIDCEAFPQGQVAQETRSQLRQKLGIGPDDLVVLFVGRLIFNAKAHPVPMYLAMERAAQATKSKVHLIQAGWFEDQQQEVAFKNTASVFSPTVNHLFVDGRQPEIRQDIWSVADVFISLADNIQETFGLTPVEAMAAGLPVVVADWDGYKDTVRHELDGFRVPTLMPPPGCGLDFAANYHDDNLNYSTYVGHISQMTAVDVDACTEALTVLLTQPEVRQRLGENGRVRAREIYDWSVVIGAYEALWEELAELRTKAKVSAPVAAEKPPHPLCDDPFHLLSHYPTQSLGQDMVLGLGAMAAPEKLQALRTSWMTNFGADKRSPTAMIDQVLEAIAKEGSIKVADILQRFAGSELGAVVYLSRTLVYLLKFDVLRQVR
ncbi:glycosyltransferase family 4 protein [Allocoleopsis franciscana]|uniref:Glycosyltransferase n=1 Tax=Allocoleopsis franciscana PCC 7113 TaxID=1173027 RepID=K9WNH8_9CYAN|nr:glycosyltransferase family 4 protein [Allocoleopsis franciscana]AFZ21067.1 glycosyltransferase [Allocoleopsis franciscana PCC 7113]